MVSINRYAKRTAKRCCVCNHTWRRNFGCCLLCRPVMFVVVDSVVVESTTRSKSWCKLSQLLWCHGCFLPYRHVFLYNGKQESKCVYERLMMESILAMFVLRFAYQ